MAHDEMASIREFLEQRSYFSPWVELHSIAFEALEGIATVKSIKKGQILFEQDTYCEYCYIVKSGRFRIFFIDSNGTENCLYIAESGCLIGELPAFDDALSCVSGRAIVAASVYAIKYRQLREMVYKDPSVGMLILREQAKKQRILVSKLEYYNTSADSRVAITLLALCLKYGIIEPSGIKIGIKFTHEELANLAGLNRVTVSRIYQKLKSDNIIVNLENLIIIKKPERLRQIVNLSGF